MALSYERAAAILKSHLSAGELERGVAYAAEKTVAARATLKFPRLSIRVPWEAYLAFVDRNPMANWGHSCRYLLIRCQSGEVQSFEAQFPPFSQSRDLRWHVVYKAPSVPESMLAVRD